jgi:endogenous inhibitor of DNA gyrase (YacG/DUF329 family)
MESPVNDRCPSCGKPVVKFRVLKQKDRLYYWFYAHSVKTLDDGRVMATGCRVVASTEVETWPRDTAMQGPR